MRVIQDVVKGAIKLNGLVDRVCFSSWRDFVLSLPDLLSVEVPASVSGVIVGNNVPNEDERDKVWYRRDGSGNFVGVFIFQAGAWHPFYNYAPNEVVWMYGNSTDIPEGFTLITTGDAVVPSTVVTALIPQYVPLPTGGYSYFAVRFTGY